jgi:hypothetical protein
MRNSASGFSPSLTGPLSPVSSSSCNDIDITQQSCGCCILVLFMNKDGSIETCIVKTIWAEEIYWDMRSKKHMLLAMIYVHTKSATDASLQNKVTYPIFQTLINKPQCNIVCEMVDRNTMIVYNHTYSGLNMLVLLSEYQTKQYSIKLKKLL